jgi:hypothetical protein
MANFSCYITIINNSSLKFINGSSGQSWGEYASRPVTNLNPEGSTSFRLKDSAGPAGSTGWAKYEVGEGILQFNYDCPYGDASNVLSFDNGGTGLIISLYGTNQEGYETSIPSGKEGQYPSDSHPLSGVFIVTDPS